MRKDGFHVFVTNSGCPALDYFTNLSFIGARLVLFMNDPFS